MTDDRAAMRQVCHEIATRNAAEQMTDARMEGRRTGLDEAAALVIAKAIEVANDRAMASLLEQLAASIRGRKA